MNRDDLLRLLAAQVWVQHNGKLDMPAALKIAEAALAEVDLQIAFKTDGPVQ
jgi:hypothetical protein